MKPDFSGKREIYLEVAEKYESYIRIGILSPGEKLPSVREAACEMSVNPNTVARAYSKLEEEGYIKSLPKKGAFVTYGEEQSEKASEPDKKNIIYAFRDMGISKATLQKWIEEVYGEND